MVFGESVSIYSPQEIPAIQFAVKDLTQTIELKGRECKNEPLSALTDEPENMRLVLGLQHDEVLAGQLQAVSSKNLENISAEGYAIRVTRTKDLVTIWAIGADATGAMYAGLSLAETIAQERNWRDPRNRLPALHQKTRLEDEYSAGCAYAVLRGLRRRGSTEYHGHVGYGFLEGAPRCPRSRSIQHHFLMEPTSFSFDGKGH